METTVPERESHPKYRCTDIFFHVVRKRTGKKLFHHKDCNGMLTLGRTRKFITQPWHKEGAGVGGG